MPTRTADLRLDEAGEWAQVRLRPHAEAWIERDGLQWLDISIDQVSGPAGAAAGALIVLRDGEARLVAVEVDIADVRFSTGSTQRQEIEVVLIAAARVAEDPVVLSIRMGNTDVPLPTAWPDAARGDGAQLSFYIETYEEMRLHRFTKDVDVTDSRVTTPAGDVQSPGELALSAEHRLNESGAFLARVASAAPGRVQDWRIERTVDGTSATFSPSSPIDWRSPVAFWSAEVGESAAYDVWLDLKTAEPAGSIHFVTLSLPGGSLPRASEPAAPAA